MPNRPPRRPPTGAPKRRKPVAIETPKAERLLQLKVTLLGSKPSIWRRIVVPDNYSLAQLHVILQVAMGWTFDHLHGFRWRDERWGPPAEDYGLFETTELDENAGFLARFFTQKGDSLRYEYDFGDSWEHEIKLERTEPFDPARPVPVCLAGARAGPPEDCGGIWGYAAILHARKHPRARGSAERLEWVGEEFDPEAFDLAAVNRNLRPRQS
jgi:hypothetical protein